LLLCYRAGQPFALHPFNSRQLILAGRLDQNELIQRSAAREFAVVQLRTDICDDPAGDSCQLIHHRRKIYRFTDEVLYAIDRHCRIAWRSQDGTFTFQSDIGLRDGEHGDRLRTLIGPELVRYVSSRDPRPSPPALSFVEVLLAGLAEDGGLYVPHRLPALGAGALQDYAGLPYAELAARVVSLFVGETFSTDDLRRLTAAAYVGFRHAAVAPLVQLDERLWLLELFHGPTFAFKDLALQLVGRLFDAVLARQREHVTILGATSGDTGSAAIEACRDREAIDIFMLFPHNRVSEVQRRQMTTVESPNAHAIAIEGSFDDCQDLVKALFADTELRHTLNLSAVNSINWARIAAQTVYYFAAGLALGAPTRPVSFSVPTGNFGNVYAGHIARRMGLPIDRLVIGTNQNDILARYFATGRMALAPVEPSLSPSMDIQVSSNFERLLFELKGRNGAAVGEAMRLFRQNGCMPEDDQGWRTARRLFSAHKVDDTRTMQTIAETYAGSGMLIDPHTGVAIAAARAELAAAKGSTPIIALATAHPAKFPEAVERATGIRPVLPLALGGLLERRERLVVLPNELGHLTRFIRTHSRRIGNS
jgi:threonine synthase